LSQTKQAQLLRNHLIFETALAVIETKAKIRLHQQKPNDDSVYIDTKRLQNEENPQT